MSFEKRRQATVLSIIQELVQGGQATLRPGDVNAVLRERNQPMGTWEVRAEFSRLERESILECDADTGDWRLTENAALKNAG